MKKKDNVFFTLGISFVGVSIVFIAAVNKAIGMAFMGLGIVYMVIGIKKSKK